MALNDILKHMPSINDAFSDFKSCEELSFANLSQNKVLSAPPYCNVSKYFFF